MGNTIKLIILVVVAGIAKVSINIFSDGELKRDIPDYYWGPKNLQNEKEDTKIYPFQINIEEKVIQDLKLQLKAEINSKKLIPPLEGVNFEYGFNSKYLTTITNYWLNKYDWRSREKLLNEYPQFRTKIAGINIHFQHVKSKNTNSKYRKTIPLLLLHGWPGSFVEFQKIIPLLVDPRETDINFELVIPSLPGYGFSEAAVRPGLGSIEMAQIFQKLMIRLGHDRFYVQGGDWGAIIASHLATIYPDNVLAVHSNLCQSQHPRSFLRLFASLLSPSFFYTSEEADRFLSRSVWTFLLRESGYSHIQATKPDTVGIGLTYSPSGLAAYILEKFSTWTNENWMTLEDGGLTNAFSLDELLDNVMVYWTTSSITTSMRLYAEQFSKQQSSYGVESVPIKVPTACLIANNEPFIAMPKSMMQDKFQQLISYKYIPFGGHFLGFEHPQALADDIISFVQQVNKIISSQSKKKSTETNPKK